jgi:DNA primase small subunit
VFPYESYVRWVGAGGASSSPSDKKAQLSRREFSFTLADDVYLRYLSFSSAEELKAEMLRRLPHKIDLGAVYNARPSDHQKLANFQVN